MFLLQREHIITSSVCTGHQCLKERLLAAVEDSPVCLDGSELLAPRPAAAILRATSMSSFIINCARAEEESCCSYSYFV